MPNSALEAFGIGTALLAGYVFIRLSTYRRFAAERLRSDRYALHVVGFTLVFYAAGSILAYYLASPTSSVAFLKAMKASGIPAQVFYAIVIAAIAAKVDEVAILIRMSSDSALLLTNDKSIPGRIRLAAVALYVRKSNDAALRAVFRATFLSKQLMVTLKGGKVYVGGLPRQFDPCDFANSLRIIPVASGYRDKDTKEVVFSTQYTALDRGSFQTPLHRTSRHIQTMLCDQILQCFKLTRRLGSE